MTASLYRHLVDLPPGLLSLWPDARTTDEVIEAGRDPLDLAEDIRRAAQERDLRVFVATLNDPQSSDIGTPALATPGAADRKLSDPLIHMMRNAMIRRLEADALCAPHRQHVRNYAPPGPPAVVVCLWDGRIRADASQRSRRRRDKRFTLDDDVLQWVETEAARREVSQSSVVQDALREGMRPSRSAHKLCCPAYFVLASGHAHHDPNCELSAYSASRRLAAYRASLRDGMR